MLVAEALPHTITIDFCVAGVSQAVLGSTPRNEGCPGSGAPGGTPRPGGQVLEWLQVPAWQPGVPR